MFSLSLFRQLVFVCLLGSVTLLTLFVISLVDIVTELTSYLYYTTVENTIAERP